jgi:hypothetical protein
MRHLSPAGFDVGLDPRMLSWGKEILRGHVARPKIEPVCGVMGVSASAYYQRATGERSRRRVEEARVLERIRAAARANYYASG